MSARVHVVDYGLGNLHSVVNALKRVGADPILAERGADLASAERVVLPGVGAFADGMRGLAERGHATALRALAGDQRPLLGICLGAQLMLSSSDEFGRHDGLGLIPGRVVRIPDAGVAGGPRMKVPHVGWNRVRASSAPWTATPLAGTADGAWAYFVHSFHALPDDPRDVLATCAYGAQALTAAVARGRAWGFQFHPEKSGQAGLAMLAAFLRC